MKKVLGVTWAAVPPLLLSALVHSTDPDIGGIAGLARTSVMLSVLFWGLPVIVMTMLCLWIAVQSRWWWWIVPGVVFSAALAVAIAALQTPAPQGLGGFVRPLLGGTLIVWLFLAAAVVPARALGWPTGSREPAAD